MSPDEAKAALKRLQSLLPVVSERDMSVTLMYRTLCSSHLISAWKQQIAMAKPGRNWNSPWRTVIGDKPTKSEPPPLSEWLGHGIWEGRIEFHIENIIAGWLNPIGLANAFVQYDNVNAIIGDMSGMAHVPNTVACEVLQIPCTNDGNIVGRPPTKKSILLNKRSNPTELGMTDGDLEEAEEILLRMDCFFYCNNGLKDNLTVLHAKDEMFTDSKGWNKCCESPESFLTPSAAYLMLKNLGCRASGKGVIRTKSNTSSKVIQQSSLSDNPMMIQSNFPGGTAKKRPILLDEDRVLVQQNVFFVHSKRVSALFLPGIVVFFAAKYRKRRWSNQHLTGKSH